MVSSVATVSAFFEPLKYTDMFGRPIEIFQVSPNGEYLSGDRGVIVMEVSESFGGRNRYGYAFAKSTVIVTIISYGARSEGEVNIVDVGSIKVSYNKDTTEILSVTWSDKKEAYLLTFKEDGLVHTEWLDFDSSVFREMIWLECPGISRVMKTDRHLMGVTIHVINNKTTGIEFQAEDRKK